MPATEVDTRSLAYTALKTLNDPKSVDPEALHDFGDYDFDDAFAPESFSEFFGGFISEAEVADVLAQLNAERASEQETKITYEQTETKSFAWKKDLPFEQEKETYFAPVKGTKFVETEFEPEDCCDFKTPPSLASEVFTLRNGTRAAVIAFYMASALNVRVNPIALLALQIICIFCFFRLL